MNTAIVIASDAAYFRYLRDLVQSIRQHRPDDSLPICVMDLGLSYAQREELAPLINGIATAQWDISFPAATSAPSWFKAMVDRPSLPKYFPEAQCIIWLDADTWLQDWRTIEWLLKGSEDGSLAITVEMHRAYSHLFKPVNDIRLCVRHCYKAGWGEEMARNMTWIPSYNTGVFALRSDSPLWGQWAQVLAQGLQTCNEQMVEQNALNIAIQLAKPPIHPLPVICNWTCNLALPMYDREHHRLVEPVLPHEPISIVHQIQLRGQTVRLKTLQGDEADVPLDYSGFQSMLTRG